MQNNGKIFMTGWEGERRKCEGERLMESCEESEICKGKMEEKVREKLSETEKQLKDAIKREKILTEKINNITKDNEARDKKEAKSLNKTTPIIPPCPPINQYLK